VRNNLEAKARLLEAYDEQQRTDAETLSAVTVVSCGPLRLGTFTKGHGFVTYQNLYGAGEDAIRRLAPEVLTYYHSDPEITRVEWKTRGHDTAPGLHEALLENGFIPDEPESIMIGEATALQSTYRCPMV